MTTTDATARSAMKLALEALKQIDEAMPFPVAKLAQSALREALASQGEALASEAIEQKSGIKQVIELYDSPDQPSQQQEPVYWQWRRKDQPWSLEYTFNSEVQVTTKDSERRALYTSPPAQRTWVNATTWRGLTDEEILIMSRYDLEYAALIGEVQRKLKEKNCG